MIIGQKVTFASGGVFECLEGGWRRTAWPGNEAFFHPSLQKSFRILFDAYIWPDGSGPLFFSDWLGLLIQDGITLPHFFEYNPVYEVAVVFRHGWLGEYSHLQKIGTGQVNEY